MSCITHGLGRIYLVAEGDPSSASVKGSPLRRQGVLAFTPPVNQTLSLRSFVLIYWGLLNGPPFRRLTPHDFPSFTPSESDGLATLVRSDLLGVIQRAALQASHTA